MLHDAVLTGINIFILFFCLSLSALQPRAGCTGKAEKEIADELALAAGDMADASALKEEYETKLKNVNKEAEDILEAARKKAKTERQRSSMKQGQRHLVSLSEPTGKSSWRKRKLLTV